MERLWNRRPGGRCQGSKTTVTSAGVGGSNHPNESTHKTVHVAPRIADGHHNQKGDKIRVPQHTVRHEPRNGTSRCDLTSADQRRHETMGGRSIAKDKTNGSCATTPTRVGMKARAADATASAATRTPTSESGGGRANHGIGVGMGPGVERIDSWQRQPVGLGRGSISK